MNNYEVQPMRGEIYYITRGTNTGSEQETGRPGIIVSNAKCNLYSSTVEVVYLTTQSKPDLPTHVTIRSTTRQSTALCEGIYTIDKSRIGDYVGICSDAEMAAVDLALAISLGIESEGAVKEVVKEVPVEVIKEVPVEVIKEVPVESPELLTVKAQLEYLQGLYNNLLERIMPAKRGRKGKETE